MTNALLMILIAVAYGIRADLTGRPSHNRLSGFWFVGSLAMSCLFIADLWGWL